MKTQRQTAITSQAPTTLAAQTATKATGGPVQAQIERPNQAAYQHLCGDVPGPVAPAPASGLCDLATGKHRAQLVGLGGRTSEITIEKLADGRVLVPVHTRLQRSARGEGGPKKLDQWVVRKEPTGRKSHYAGHPQRRATTHQQHYLVVGDDGAIDHKWSNESTFCVPGGRKGSGAVHHYKGDVSCNPRGQVFVSLEHTTQSKFIGQHLSA